MAKSCFDRGTGMQGKGESKGEHTRGKEEAKQAKDGGRARREKRRENGSINEWDEWDQTDEYTFGILGSRP